MGGCGRGGALIPTTPAKWLIGFAKDAKYVKELLEIKPAVKVE